MVGVILFVDDGYLSELEVFSHEERSEFAGLPDPAALHLINGASPTSTAPDGS